MIPVKGYKKRERRVADNRRGLIGAMAKRAEVRVEMADGATHIGQVGSVDGQMAGIADGSFSRCQCEQDSVRNVVYGVIESGGDGRREPMRIPRHRPIEPTAAEEQ